jgi:hypothetical protein
LAMEGRIRWGWGGLSAKGEYSRVSGREKSRRGGVGPPTRAARCALRAARYALRSWRRAREPLSL